MTTKHDQAPRRKPKTARPSKLRGRSRRKKAVGQAAVLRELSNIRAWQSTIHQEIVQLGGWVSEIRDEIVHLRGMVNSSAYEISADLKAAFEKAGLDGFRSQLATSVHLLVDRVRIMEERLQAVEKPA